MSAWTIYKKIEICQGAAKIQLACVQEGGQKDRTNALLSRF